MVEIKDDEHFRRDGDDLLYELALSFSQAALGTSVVIPTPYGDESLAVPAGVQSGTVLRMRGKGLPRLGGSGTGDINVRTHLWTPDDLSAEQKLLFAELAKHEGEGPSRKGGFWSKLKDALRAETLGR
jgi:molecular chaperone DnaJ